MKMNARRLIHRLGGQAEVRRKLISEGHNIKLDTVEKWCVRGSIPGEWLVHLSSLGKFDLSEFKVKPNKKVKKK